MKDEMLINGKVLITSPSTNTAEHIGGIATFTGLLIENNMDVNYIHFVRGREKNKKRRVSWLLKQPLLLLKYISTLMHIKNIKIVHINMPMEKYAVIRDTLLTLIASIFGKKVIVHIHGGQYSMSKDPPYFIKILIKISLLLSHRIITLGKTEKQFIKNYYKVNPENIHSLGSAVKVREEVIGKAFDSIINVLYLGRIDRNKGLREIIQALKLLQTKHEIKFLIAGEGPEKREFLQECEKQIPGKYEYLGVVSGPEKQQVLDKTHIILMPSYYEGLPLSLLEAMANKIIPIVTPVGSIPEVVRDGYNGFMIPVHDYQTICERLIEAIENPARMAAMGQNAYNIIKSEYSITDYIFKINNIYQELQPHV